MPFQQGRSSVAAACKGDRSKFIRNVNKKIFMRRFNAQPEQCACLIELIAATLPAETCRASKA